MDEVLSSCRVGKGSILHAQWPQKKEKEERRKRYGKGWDSETVERKTKDERKLRRESRAAKTGLRGPAGKQKSEMVKRTIRSTLETGGDEQTSSMRVSGDRPGEEIEVEAEGEYTDAGAQDLGGEVAHEEQDDQQADEQGHEERVTRELEQDDPFADEDDNKENRDPMGAFLNAPVVEPRANDNPTEELFVFDESNSGIRFDLMEEVVQF